MVLVLSPLARQLLDQRPRQETDGFTGERTLLPLTCLKVMEVPRLETRFDFWPEAAYNDASRLNVFVNPWGKVALSLTAHGTRRDRGFARRRTVDGRRNSPTAID